MSNMSHSNQLTITITTDDPETFRFMLARSIARSMRNYIVAEDDTKEQLALVTLLESILRDAREPQELMN